MILERTPEGFKKDNLELSNARIRLERSYNNILHLKNRLSSYSCEPRTYSLFHKLEDLKLQIELLSIEHLKLMNTLKKPVHFIDLKKQQVKDSIASVNLIEQDVSKYIALAK